MGSFSMAVLALMLPILFILHDFEEIIIMKAWQQKYAKLLSKSLQKPFGHWVSPEAGAVAVLIEFLLLLIVALLSIYFQNYYVWFGMFFVFVSHFLVHYFLSIRFGHYTPGVFTAIMLMPLCLYILYVSAKQVSYSVTGIIIVCVVSTAVFIPFFKWLTTMIHTFAQWLSRYASKISQ